MMCSRSRLAVAVWCALSAVALSARIKSGSNHITVVSAADQSISQPDNVSARLADNELESKPVHERYPYAVLFGRTCGGTIISPTWILTAGHCTLFIQGKMVLAGTNNSEDGSGVSVKFKRLVIHPLFSVGPYWLNPKEFNIAQVSARWDFLLAELTQPLVFDNTTIKAANLDNVPALRKGTHVGFAGYGAKHHGETMRHHMHAMELETLDDNYCKAHLPEYNPEDMLCARGTSPRNDTACNGDSGSGLLNQDGNLLGVASWVENDALECRNGNIIVFSRVSSVREWIRDITGI